MRIFVNEFSGHPFQIQLSREFARRGHEVKHVYFAGNTSTPKGAVTETGEQPSNLMITGLNIGGAFAKHSPLKRRAADIEYGRVVSEAVRQFKPDAVLSSNMPPDGQKILIQEVRKHDASFVYWLQDVYGLAVRFFFERRAKLLANVGGAYYERLERKLLEQSDAVVCISDGFIDYVRKWGIDERKLQMIENWAPLDEITPMQKDNAWARENGVHDKFCFMYSGTLGMKHRPELLLSLARELEKTGHAILIVNGAGVGAEWLREQTKDISPDVFRLQPFQPYERLSEVMGAADVLITLLDSDAGKFAVPSKSLAYLCAGRAILMAAPLENQTVKVIQAADAGLVVSPESLEGFVAAARELMECPEELLRFGRHARAYAESHFDIGPIADRFLSLLEKPASPSIQPVPERVALPA
jgi:glycosyltransferase involved in cell wall biosynthesis